MLDKSRNTLYWLEDPVDGLFICVSINFRAAQLIEISFEL